MKSWTIAMLFAVLWFTVLSGRAMAHPPSDVILGFNSGTGILTVTAPHKVSSPKTHYIKNITVYLNGNKIIAQDFSQQTDGKLQKAQYTVMDAVSGSTVSASATCNIQGSLKKEIKIK